MAKVAFSVGICAYNEEENIGRLITELLNQRLDDNQVMQELIVISSGSTDKTNDIVKEFANQDPRIKLIAEKTRRGKSSAVNIFIKKSRSKYLVLTSADVIPDKKCLHHLLTKLRKRGVGLTAPRILPINSDKTLVGYAVHLQWNLHHKINLQFPERPKVGELVAFKKTFTRIPISSPVDEASIEPLIHFQGYKVVYCPEAVIYNKGPESIRDFLRQRRRIYAGHSQLRKRYGYTVITYSNARIIGALLANFDWNTKNWPKLFAVLALESIGRLTGFLDYKFKIRNHTVWKIAKSTKKLT